MIFQILVQKKFNKEEKNTIMERCCFLMCGFHLNLRKFAELLVTIYDESWWHNSDLWTVLTEWKQNVSVQSQAKKQEKP